MRDTFEKTWASLGDQRFAAAARSYIQEQPPNHRSLRWYGANFAAWLERGFSDELIGGIRRVEPVDSDSKRRSSGSQVAGGP
jgi:hypothetical protein